MFEIVIPEDLPKKGDIAAAYVAKNSRAGTWRSRLSSAVWKLVFGGKSKHG
jgi:hypothetical protein